MKRGNSIFDNCNETGSQEEFLQRCRFALQETPPDSVPIIGISQPLNAGATSQSQSASDDDSLIDSRHDPVETEPIRFVSPPTSVDTVDSEEKDEADRTAPVESEVEGKRLRSAVKEDGGKRLKIPVRDVVKAIVMNSRKTEEDVEKMSCVQVLVQKGFKFPGNSQNPSRS